MKKHTKRVLALALAAVMTVGYGSAAMAGTITAGQSRTEEETGGPGAVSGGQTAPSQGASVEGPSAAPDQSAVVTPGQSAEAGESSGVVTPGQSAPGAQPQQGGQGWSGFPQVDNSPAVGAVENGVIVDKVYGRNGQITSVGMKLNGIPGAISYGVYVNNGGYLPWCGDGRQAGGLEDSTYIEAIQVAITGEAAKKYNVYYRGVSAIAGQHGWATNEEMMGTVDRGDYLTSIEVVLVPKENGAPGSYEGRFYTNYSEYIRIGDNGSTCLNPDGTGFTGWVDHDRSRYYFVNGQALTGWQYIDGLKFYFNERGALIMDVDPIIGKQDRYVLKVNKEMNCLTVYAKDGDNGYIIPVKAMLTSVGDDTPVGTFRTPEKYRWRFMVNGTYTQYATRITAGFLLHSITYETTNENTLITPGYNMLGVTRSLGCVRLNAWNSKWIYDNCVLGTDVVIYNDASSPGPFFKPYQVWIPADQTYDPTDPKFAGQ